MVDRLRDVAASWTELHAQDGKVIDTDIAGAIVGELGRCTPMGLSGCPSLTSGTPARSVRDLWWMCGPTPTQSPVNFCFVSQVVRATRDRHRPG